MKTIVPDIQNIAVCRLMRNIVYFLMCIFLLSCTGNKKSISWEVEYKMYKDSLLKADSILKDSLKLTIGNEALGQIKFGMNSKQFKRAKQEFMDSVKGPLDDYYVGNTEFHEIYPEFNKEGELYQIKVVTYGIYELYEPNDIYNTSAFVEYLTNKYGLSKDDKKEKWIIGNTSFVRRPSNISSKKKLTENPEWYEGCSTEEKYIYKDVISCTIDLVISNKNYID